MEWFVYISVFLSIVISGLTVLVIKIESKVLKLILSFSGAYLFSISVLHLIPALYSGGNNAIGVYILAGFFAQILLELFSQGIEHGHVHVPHHEKKFPASMMIALCIHSFLEGLPLAKNFASDVSNQLLMGIILHNIPIAIALTSMLLHPPLTKQTVVFWLVVFALMTPLGTFAGNFIGGTAEMIREYSDRIMAVVVGIFLHISTTILFESSEHHRFNIIKFITIIIGAALAFVTI